MGKQEDQKKVAGSGAPATPFSCDSRHMSLYESTLALYRRMASVKEMRAWWKQHGDIVVTADFQRHLLQKVIRDPLCAQYSPSVKYQRTFLKTYISYVEAIDDELLEMYLKLMNQTEESDGEMREVCYKTYDVGSPVGLVTIKMANQLDSVGLTSWEAGFYLAEYFLSHTEVLSKKNVLELGSGIGLTGITLCKGIDVQHFTLTDYTQEIVRNMKRNVEINNLEESLISVQELDWESPDLLQQANMSNIDVILVADCVYDPGLVIALVRVLKILLLHSPDATAYIATTKRQPQTFELFMSTLQESSLDHTLLDTSTPEHAVERRFVYPDAEVLLSKVTLRDCSSSS